MKQSWVYRSWVLLPFAAVVACFSVGTVLSQWSARTIDEAALSIATNAAPSIEHLAAVRTDLRHMYEALDDYFDDPVQHIASLDAYSRAREAIDDHVRTYVALPVYPGERELWSEVGGSLTAVEEAAGRALGRSLAKDVVGARRVLQNEVKPLIERASEQLSRSISLDAGQAHRLAMRIETARAHVAHTAYWLDALSAVVACVLAVMALRAARRYTRLLERHGELVQQRADELEQFSGRVAHDVLSPLSTAAVAFALLERRAPDDVTARRQIELGRNSVALVQSIVDGLLAFARAGARPARNARADVARVVNDVVEETRPSADSAGIELVVPPPPPCEVACDPGVLTSVVANLLRNAVKYTAGVYWPRVELRVLARDSLVRVEVEDNGPGIPAGFEERIFEPYVRAPGLRQAGLGLGLATVHRIVRAHRGEVGVRSVPGRGCLFWFELPRLAVVHAVAEDSESAPPLA
jgi:signal transduction histidine kinase